ncbi:MAG: AMMECR1 domain-containing protein [Parcubacteria group bacterium]|nr:AMMECR1 domain-containing protein [Parcubacteria group bacterium]
MEERLKKIIKSEVFITKKEATIVSQQGRKLDWIFDFRRILLVPEYIDLIAEIFWEKYKDKYPFQVCGLETAAIPLVTAIVMKSVQKEKPINGFFIRKSRKKYGLTRLVEGSINKEKIIIVDDLISYGDAVKKQIQILDELGKKVSEVFVIMHFKQLKYYDFLKNREIILTSLFPLTDFGPPFQKIASDKKYLGDAFIRKWYFKSENPNYFYVIPKSAPAIDGDKIYFGSDSGYFWALNQNDGSVSWKYKVGLGSRGKSVFSSPAVYDNTVYFGAYDGNVYALDTKTGKRKWVFMEADWVGSSPALAPDLGLLFIGLQFGLWNKKGGIAALDLKTGEKKWEHLTSEYTPCSPTYSKEKKIVAIGSNDSAVYLCDAKNGKLLWKFQTKGEIKSSLVFDEKRNTVIFGNFEGKLYVVDIKTGHEVFSYQAEFGIYSTPVIYKDNIYFSSLDKHLYSINLDTQKLNWKFQTGGRILASPIIINDKLYIGSNDERLYEINLDTGEMLAFFQTTERITNKIAYNKGTKQFFLSTFANEIYCLKRIQKNDKKYVQFKLPSLPTVEAFDKNEKEFALALSRKTLALFLHAKNKNNKLDRNIQIPQKLLSKSFVGVSFWMYGSLRGCQIVRGKKIYDAIIEATKRAAQDMRFKSLNIIDLDVIRIQISIISNKWDEIDKKRIKNLEINPMAGYFLSSKEGIGWFLPEVFNIVPFANMEQLVFQLAIKKAKISPELLADKETTIYSFSTDDFMEGKNGNILDLEGPIVKTEIETTEKKVVGAAKRAADWMLPLMDKDGGLVTILNPYGKIISHYDWARTIFSGWVLAEFGRMFNQESHIQAARNNFEYNKKNIFDDSVHIKNKLLVLSYLGQQALSLSYLPEALLCADAIVTQLQNEPFHPLTFSQIGSFLGTMALRGNKKYLNYALQCATAVKNSFDERGTNGIPRSIAEYAELVNTLSILYGCTGEKKHADASKEMALWILKNQLESGAFKNTESSNFSYTRGTSKAVEVLSLFNPSSFPQVKQENYRNQVLRAFKWLLSMQYNELNSFFIDSQEVKKYLGGFRHDYLNTEAWIDSAAHFILAITRFYKP